MFIEKIEETKEYTNYFDNVDKAISEQHRYGFVTHETHKKVSDSFGDVYSKFTNKQFTFEVLISYVNVLAKINDYNKITGNSYDVISGLVKIGLEGLQGWIGRRFE